jgi:hypothetical protein
MRAQLALCMTLILLGPNVGVNGAVVQQQQDPAKPEQPPATATPATDAKAADSQTVKPIAACGFCLEDGTKVQLILGRELSSGKESTGNRVDFEVSEDIRVNDVIVIPKGSLAYGTITEAQERRRLGRAGKLNVRIEEVRLADGSRAKLRAVQESKGKGRQGLMTAAIIGTGILFFPAAPVFLFMRGKDVVIAKGTPVVSYVDGNTELELAKFVPAAKPVTTAASAAVAAPQPAETTPTPEQPVAPATTPPPPLYR